MSHTQKTIFFPPWENYVTLPKKDPLNIDSNDAAEFMLAMEERAELSTVEKYSKTYVKSMYRQLKGFYRFIYDHRIYLNSTYETDIHRNPFAEVYCIYQDKEELTLEDIPSYEDLDLLLDAAESNMTLSLAIKLVIRIGLTASELLSIKKSNFILSKENLYLELIDRDRKGQVQKRTMFIPEDLHSAIDYVATRLPETEKHIIVNVTSKSGIVKPYTMRTLLRHLNQCCLDADIETITFSKLRNFFIFQAKLSGIDNGEIAEFTNQEGRWIYRFDLIDVSNVLRTAEYIHFTLK